MYISMVLIEEEPNNNISIELSAESLDFDVIR